MPTIYHYHLATAEILGPLTMTDHFFPLLMAFILACFIGYHVVWAVTPALHSPLMGVTNAISSVIIVGAILALISGTDDNQLPLNRILGMVAIFLTSVNIVGGFLVTQRMLGMFQKKPINSKKSPKKSLKNKTSS